jgi:hypothetical protein
MGRVITLVVLSVGIVLLWWRLLLLLLVVMVSRSSHLHPLHWNIAPPERWTFIFCFLYRVIPEAVSVFWEVIVSVIIKKNYLMSKSSHLQPLPWNIAPPEQWTFIFCVSLYRVILEEASEFWEVIVSVIVRDKIFEHASNSECLPR